MVEIELDLTEETKQKLEADCERAFELGEHMASDAQYDEEDNPFQVKCFRKSWLYGFKSWRKNRPWFRARKKLDWQKEGF